MAEVIAKLRHEGKDFEILVDLDKAMDFKNGEQVSFDEILVIDTVFTDSKKGMHASEEDLNKAFGTLDVKQIAEKIIKKGNIQLTTEYRHKLREAKQKQVIAFLSRNCIDPKTGLPHPPQRLENAINEAGIKIDEFKNVDDQVNDIIKGMQRVLPIKIELKKLAIKIPSIHTGRAYGAVKEFLKKEEWTSEGDLVVVVEIPAGLQMEFFDKLNSVTQGSAETKEIKE